MHPHARAGNLAEYPRRVYWELTRACGLACSHCRAEAQQERLPDELNTEEAFALLCSLAKARHKPVVVLTGGDPLERPDFWEIFDFAKQQGLNVDVAPSATPKLTRDVVFKLKERGVGAMSLSLDGSTPSSHDALRGIDGCYSRTMNSAKDMADAGVPLQVNTLVTANTLPDMPAICRQVETMTAKRWSLFFLITTGRGSLLPQITASQAEDLLNWAWEAGQKASFMVAATEAPMYRRVIAQRSGKPPNAPVPGAGMRDGSGILFISYRGDVSPSGFLPRIAGNVRDADVLRIYRESPEFLKLRDTGGFGGRCGVCEYRESCGGSRSRAYAATGDILAEDPLCAYEPQTPSPSS